MSVLMLFWQPALLLSTYFMLLLVANKMMMMRGSHCRANEMDEGCRWSEWCWWMEKLINDLACTSKLGINCLFNGTSAHFRLFVPRTVKIKQIKQVRNDFILISWTHNAAVDENNKYKESKHLSETIDTQVKNRHLNSTIKSSFLDEIDYWTWGNFRKKNLI